MDSLRKNDGPLGTSAVLPPSAESRTMKYRLPESLDVAEMAGANSPNAEQFRRLANYLAEPALAPTQVIAVTSPVPGDGKSFVAFNLALAFARESAGDVLLVDGDLRRAGVSHPLTPEPRLGLDAVVQERAAVEQAIVRLDNFPLWLLPSGRHMDDPVKFLTGDRFGAIVGRLRQRFTHVVIDTPPVVPFSDAVVIGGQCDGVLIVVRANNTPKAMLEEALDMLEKTRVLGVTLNGAVRSLVDLDRNYEYYHRTYYSRKD